MWPIPAGPLLLFPGSASLISHGVLWTLSPQLGGQQPLSPGPPDLARAEGGPGELPFTSTQSGPVSYTLLRHGLSLVLCLTEESMDRPGLTSEFWILLSWVVFGSSC